MSRFLNTTAVTLVLMAGITATVLADHDKPQPVPEKGLVIEVGGITIHIEGTRGQQEVSVEIAGKDGRKRSINVDIDTAGERQGSVTVGIDKNGDVEKSVGVAIRRQKNDEHDVDVDVTVNGKKRIQASKKTAPQPRKENFLGVFTQPLPNALAKQLAGVLGPGQGLLISAVLPASPAAKAGLKTSDILATYAGKQILNVKQLRELILKDQPARKVKLGVVRTAKLQEIEVTLGHRTISRLGTNNRTGRIELPNGVIVLNRGGVVLGKATVKASETGIRLSRKANKKAAKNQVRRRTVTITTSDGKSFQLHVTYIGADGKSHAKAFEGTLEVIRPKLQELPQEIRKDVESSLNRAGADVKQNRGLRLQVQPQIEGRKRSLRIYLRRVGRDGGVRIFEFDKTLEGQDALQGGELLNIDVIASELKRLSPEIRSKVEASLRRIEVPKVRIEVQKSQ